MIKRRRRTQLVSRHVIRAMREELADAGGDQLDEQRMESSSRRRDSERHGLIQSDFAGSRRVGWSAGGAHES